MLLWDSVVSVSRLLFRCHSFTQSCHPPLWLASLPHSLTPSLPHSLTPPHPSYIAYFLSPTLILTRTPPPSLTFLNHSLPHYTLTLSPSLTFAQPLSHPLSHPLNPPSSPQLVTTAPCLPPSPSHFLPPSLTYRSRINPAGHPLTFSLPLSLFKS